MYRVLVPADQIGLIDVQALTRAAGDTTDFEKALSAIGAYTPEYRVMHTVRLTFDTITLGQTRPYVTGSATGRGGQVINSVNYSNVGALLDIAGKVVAPDRMDVDLRLQVSALIDGAVQISAKVAAPVFLNESVQYRGLVEANKPVVVVGLDAEHAGIGGKAIGYISRVTLGSPQTPSP
jgi:hypothetical protein